MNTGKANQEIVYIDNALSTPIYKQIITSVQQSISNGKLAQGDQIPSVNVIATRFSVARGSVFKAYNELRGMGIIDSIPGKGYFIANARSVGKKNIFLLMSTYNPYREVFYNAFIGKLKNQATVDLYFHHHNINVFETLIQNHASYYNTFVVMPEIHKQTEHIFKQLDPRSLYILDTGLKQFGGQYPCVCQNYERDIYQFFKSEEGRLLLYKRAVLLFSSNMRNYDVIAGFERFFAAHPMQALVVRETETFEPLSGDLCMAMEDNDLVRLILTAKERGWVLGDQLGIISYNETPLKSIIAKGITTISPDFMQMGISMAEMILRGSKEHRENPFLFIDRASF